MNRRKHTAWLVAALVAAIVLATAAPALAATSGTVYGTAQLEFYAVEVSGAGSTVDNPLIYKGAPGADVYEETGQLVTIRNAGTLDGEITLQQAQAPTDGTDVWPLEAWWSTTYAMWYFQEQGGSATACVWPSPWTLLPSLAAGDSKQFWSEFKFPDAPVSLADHNMQATVAISAP